MVLLRLSVVVYLRDSVPMSPAKEILTRANLSDTFSWQFRGNHSPIGLYSAWTLHRRKDGFLCTSSLMDPGASI